MKKQDTAAFSLIRCDTEKKCPHWRCVQSVLRSFSPDF